MLHQQQSNRERERSPSHTPSCMHRVMLVGRPGGVIGALRTKSKLAQLQLQMQQQEEDEQLLLQQWQAMQQSSECGVGRTDVSSSSAVPRSPEPEDPLTGLVGQLDGGERNWSSRDPVADQLDAFVRHDAAGSAAAACSTPSTQLPSRQQQLSDFSPPSVPVAQDWIADHAARLGVEYHEVMAMIMAGKRASTDPSPPASLQSQPPQLSGVRAAALQPDSQEVGRNSSSSTLGWGSSLLGGAGRRPEIAPFAGGGSSSSSPDRSGISSLAGSGGMGAMPPPKRRNLGVVSMLTRSQQSDVTAAGGLNVGRVVEQQRGPSLDRRIDSVSAAAQQVHSDTAAGTAVANNLPAGSDGGSCAEASQAEGGGMEDTSSVQQSAPGSAGAAGASRSAALGMLGLMQQMTSTIAAQVATQLQDSLDKAVRQFSTMRSTPEGAADVSDWDGGVGAWLDDSEAALSAEDVGDFLTNEKEVGGKAGEEARDQYLEASRNVVQRGLDSAAVAEGMQAAIGNLAAAAGPTTAAAYCSGELDPGMAAALEQMGSQGSTSAAFCRGKLYTGQGPMPGVSQLLGATVPAEVWEELLENGDKRRLETQTLAARHGTRTAGAPVVPALQENELDLFQAVQASHKLQMVYGGTPKMHAARELDRLLGLAFDAARKKAGQETYAQWTPQGLPVFVFRALVLFLIDPDGHRWDPKHLPDKRVRGYAVTTTLAHVMYGLETLHAVRGIQVDPEVTAALKTELKTWLAAVYPHCVRKAIPVTDDMVHNTLDEVKAVQTPPLSVHDGDWLLELDLFTLRNIVLLLLPLASGRRLGHVVPLLQEHLKFDYEDVGDGYFCLHLNLLFPVGKGALQSQQGVPLISRVYNWKEDSSTSHRKMKYDPVMQTLLLLYFSNSGDALTWSDFIKNPKLSPEHATHGVIPDLTEGGRVTGFAVKLPEARRIIGLLLHAGGYPGCTGHGGRAGAIVNAVAFWLGYLGFVPDQAWRSMERRGGWEFNSPSMQTYIRRNVDVLLAACSAMADSDGSDVDALVAQLRATLAQLPAAGQQDASAGLAEVRCNQGDAAGAEAGPQIAAVLGAMAAAGGAAAGAATAAACVDPALVLQGSADGTAAELLASVSAGHDGAAAAALLSLPSAGQGSYAAGQVATVAWGAHTAAAAVAPAEGDSSGSSDCSKWRLLRGMNVVDLATHDWVPPAIKRRAQQVLRVLQTCRPRGPVMSPEAAAVERTAHYSNPQQAALTLLSSVQPAEVMRGCAVKFVHTGQLVGAQRELMKLYREWNLTWPALSSQLQQVQLSVVQDVAYWTALVANIGTAAKVAALAQSSKCATWAAALAVLGQQPAGSYDGDSAAGGDTSAGHVAAAGTGLTEGAVAATSAAASAVTASAVAAGGGTPSLAAGRPVLLAEQWRLSASSFDDVMPLDGGYTAQQVLRRAVQPARKERGGRAASGRPGADWPVYDQVALEGQGPHQIEVAISRMERAPCFLVTLLKESLSQDIRQQPALSLISLVTARAAAHAAQLAPAVAVPCPDSAAGADGSGDDLPASTPVLQQGAGLTASAARISVGAPAFQVKAKSGRGRMSGKTQLEAQCGADLLDMAEGLMPSQLTLDHYLPLALHQNQFAAAADSWERQQQLADREDKQSVRHELHQHALDHVQQRELWEPVAKTALQSNKLPAAAAAVLQHLVKHDKKGKKKQANSTAWRCDTLWQAVK